MPNFLGQGWPVRATMVVGRAWRSGQDAPVAVGGRSCSPGDKCRWNDGGRDRCPMPQCSRSGHSCIGIASIASKTAEAKNAAKKT